jgi:hypothetical protein
MRYIIEVKTKRGEGIIEELVDKNKVVRLIDSYDPFEKISKDVEKMGLALRQFKKSGIDWEVFTTYLRGRGLPKTTIDSVMGSVKDFFTNIGMLPEKKRS